MPGDTEDSLAARVLEAEHKLYPLALSMVASGAVRVEAETAVFLPRLNVPPPLIVPQPA
jgi:folate-dependent phosphoribosylglycinamide formyltransferase PurN